MGGGIGGSLYIVSGESGDLVGGVGAVMAAAVSFVSFLGVLT